MQTSGRKCKTQATPHGPAATEECTKLMPSMIDDTPYSHTPAPPMPKTQYFDALVVIDELVAAALFVDEVVKCSSFITNRHAASKFTAAK